jgi:hypothetical protein
MNLGLRALLLGVALVFFVIAIFSDLHQGDFIAAGLALVAAAFVVTEMGWDRRLGTGMSTRRDT